MSQQLLSKMRKITNYLLSRKTNHLLCQSGTTKRRAKRKRVSRLIQENKKTP